MRTWAHWTAKTVMLTVTFAAAGAGVSGVALAGTGASTSGNGSVLGGNQARVPVSIPANVCGNAGALLGLALAGCQGGASVRATQIGSGSTTGNGSVGGGDQAAAPVAGPVDVCGNAAAVLGDSAAGCEGTAAARTGGSPARPGESTASGSGHVSDPAIDAVTRTPGARGDSRGRGGRMTTPHQGTAMMRSPAYQGAERGLAVLGAPPVPSGTPDLTDLAAPSAAGGPSAGSTAVRNAMPASSLAADTAPGMGSASFYSLAIGALMAGAVALKMAGRHIRGRKA